MTAIARWVRSVGKSRSGASDGDETSEPTRPESSLYHCASCESVYVAVDKDACESCEAAVERVPSTLAEM